MLIAVLVGHVIPHALTSSRLTGVEVVETSAVAPKLQATLVEESVKNLTTWWFESSSRGTLHILRASRL